MPLQQPLAAVCHHSQNATSAVHPNCCSILHLTLLLCCACPWLLEAGCPAGSHQPRSTHTARVRHVPLTADRAVCCALLLRYCYLPPLRCGAATAHQRVTSTSTNPHKECCCRRWLPVLKFIKRTPQAGSWPGLPRLMPSPPYMVLCSDKAHWTRHSSCGGVCNPRPKRLRPQGWPPCCTWQSAWQTGNATAGCTYRSAHSLDHAAVALWLLHVHLVRALGDNSCTAGRALASTAQQQPEGQASTLADVHVRTTQVHLSAAHGCAVPHQGSYTATQAGAKQCAYR